MDFAKFNDDELITILINIPISDLPKMALLERRIASILNTDKFWYKKIKHDFSHEKETSLHREFAELGSYKEVYHRYLIKQRANRKFLKNAHDDIFINHKDIVI